MSVHGEDEIDACLRVLHSNTQMGENVAEFERRVARRFSKTNGIFVNSGSSALYLSVEILALPPDSEVITPALTFGTTVGCIVKNSLIPAFVDTEPDTYCIDVEQVEKLITKNTKAMCIPNLIGNLPHWDELREIANKYNLLILEDSADIIGVKYKNRNIGYYSDISTSSFYGNHIINCAGNGGIICTNDSDLSDKARLLRSWGRSSSLFQDSENVKDRFDVEIDGIPYDKKFVFEAIGYNLEGSEVGAAFGLVQELKLDSILEKRKSTIEKHTNFFRNYTEWFELPRLNPQADTVWFAFPLIVLENAPFSRRDLMVFLEKRNIQTRTIFAGNILRQPGFKNVRSVVSSDGYPNADRVMRRGLLIGAHHGMTEEMINHVHDSFCQFSKQY